MYNIPTRLISEQRRGKKSNEDEYNYRTININNNKCDDDNQIACNVSTRPQKKQKYTSFPISYTLGSNMVPENKIIDSLIHHKTCGGVKINRATKQGEIPISQQIHIDNKMKLPELQQQYPVQNNVVDNCDFLSSAHTRLDDVHENNKNREFSMNRFTGMAENSNNLQNHIFWNFSKNTQLEARDDYKKKMGK
jgi:hypothetical protein